MATFKQDDSNISHGDILQLIDEVQRLGGDMSQLPPELQALLQQVAEQPSGPASRPNQEGADTDTELITPEPGFVVKTQDEAGRKVFVNIVGHAAVAAPADWAGDILPDQVQQALDNLDDLNEAQAEALRFPLSLSTPHTETDKKGDLAVAYDICLNLNVVKQCARYRALKNFVINLALNWINHKHKTHLDPKYKLPKMKYKGGDVVESHCIRKDRKRLITEVKDMPEEPTFPLMTKKPPPGKQLPPAGQQAAAIQTGVQGAAPTQAGAQQSAHVSAGNGHPGSRPAAPAATASTTAATQVEFKLLGTPQLVGKPVDTVVIEVEIPQSLVTQVGLGSQQQQGVATRQWEALQSAVRVDVCGQQVFVSAAGHGELPISLPLAVTDKGATATIENVGKTGTQPVLRLQLPYMSVTQLVTAAMAHAPHAPGSLRFSSASTALGLEL